MYWAVKTNNTSFADQAECILSQHRTKEEAESQVNNTSKWVEGPFSFPPLEGADEFCQSCGIEGNTPWGNDSLFNQVTCNQGVCPACNNWF